MIVETNNIQFVDTHAHLNDEQFARDAGEVISRAGELGVSRIVNVAFSERLWPRAIELSKFNSGVAFTLGIHPNNASEWSKETGDRLVELLARERPAAIGETGLDYHRDRVPRDIQIAAFSDQLAIATTFSLPVVIHMRGDVESDIRELLRRRTEPMCVFHSFDGSPELARWIVERDWMIGAGGLMSRRSARELRTILTETPRSHLLLETDSPYLAPTGWPEKRNSPESIPIIADHLARLLDLPLEEIAAITTTNAQRVFGFNGGAHDELARRGTARTIGS